MKKIIFILVICIIKLSLFAQIDSSNYKLKKPGLMYLKSVIHQTDSSKNYLFTFGYQYMLSPIGKTFGAQGMTANFGINFARLFSHKIVFGFTLDLKLLKGFSNKNLSREFITNFNENFNTKYSNQTDSVNAYVVKRAINDGPGQFLVGNTLTNFGFMFSLFPQKHGGFLIQVKKGYRGFSIIGIQGNKYINNGDIESKPIVISGNWVYEITFKPVAFLRDVYVKKNDGFNETSISNRITISLFYEKLNFQSANFNGTNILLITSESFVSKYRNDNRFGIKFGLSIY